MLPRKQGNTLRDELVGLAGQILSSGSTGVKNPKLIPKIPSTHYEIISYSFAGRWMTIFLNWRDPKTNIPHENSCISFKAEQELYFKQSINGAEVSHAELVEGCFITTPFPPFGP